MEQVLLERAERWEILPGVDGEGNLVALIPSRKECDAERTVSQGCVSHTAGLGVVPGGTLLPV